MKINLLCRQNSIVSHYVAELRDVEIQKERLRFRKNLERIGELAAYEISKLLHYNETQVTTPLGIAPSKMLRQDDIVVASILRAALPMHNGVLNIFDHAENCFVSAYRKSGKDNKFTIAFGYISSPPIEGKTVVLCDPMLATGSSMMVAYNALLERGVPQATHIVSVIASRDGVEYLKKHLPPEHNVTLWVCAVDDELTAKSYIVPGLGDAGDLAYGEKV
ncbi:uracil phosphoribosyltransferase [Bacteroidia bacterium]|nr:uracil phosphoribosyltransferase [Bacteroidia bacterium]